MKTAVKCTIRTIWYSFMILVCKYALNGFSNVTRQLVANDLKFIVPATIFISAFTILVDNGIECVIYFFQELFKKNKKKENKA